MATSTAGQRQVMISPQPAPVKPRVVSPDTGEAVPLEDEILSLLQVRKEGMVRVMGPAGSGKTTALRHLAAVLPVGAPVTLHDNIETPDQLWNHPGGLVVSAGKAAPAAGQFLLHLTPWEEDDAIDYLLALHRECCTSVMARLRAAPDRDLLDGTPELWGVVLEQMAQDHSLAGVQAALERFLDGAVPDPEGQTVLRQNCLAGFGSQPGEAESFPPGEKWPDDVRRLLRHDAVRLILASRQIVADMRAGTYCRYLAERLPFRLVRQVGAALASDLLALANLHQLIKEFPQWQAMGASILHAAGSCWRPTLGPGSVLAGAYLAGVQWPGIQLASADLSGADLASANLEKAVLDYTVASKIRLHHANLRCAALSSFQATQANLAHADLSFARALKARFDFADLRGAVFNEAMLKSSEFQGANLTSASFRKANLTGAFITVTELANADFSDANLEKANFSGVKLRLGQFRGANFKKANLSGCDLEGMYLPGADFQNANLASALLTGSVMPKANLAGACLRETGLADVQWEEVNLRGADLRGAAFHMGSSRSGLLFTPIASEGSRTGFYTDDYLEQHFKDPAEIRKANLCGADLRGAQIGDVDFYLVDLRGATYDPDQERHFRRCGAILEDRA
jgi:uncharacterized protein YjbI with pentapeptide repeats